MDNLIRALTCLLFFTLIACQSESPKTTTPTIQSQNPPSMYFLLIFKKEKKLEIWQTDQDFNEKFVETLPLESCELSPIGIFKTEMTDEAKIQLKFPNEFYSLKAKAEGANLEDLIFFTTTRQKQQKYSISLEENFLEKLKTTLLPDVKTQTLIFPNDTRMGGTFDACIGCPYWMAEMYSSLELHLKKFGEPPLVSE